MSQTDHNTQPELATVDKLRLLLDITKTISRSLDLDEVLNLVMDTLGSLIPYEWLSNPLSFKHPVSATTKVARINEDDSIFFIFLIFKYLIYY